MSSKTTNYNLHKIDLNDAPPDITVLNENWDKIDDELANRLPLEGGELSGELIVNDNFHVRKTFNDIPYRSYIRPTNYALGDDYTTALIHYINGTSDSQFIFNRNGAMLRDNINNKAYQMFGQHNTDLAKKNMNFFYNLTEIGVTVGSETIEDIATKLPVNSRLVSTVGSTNNLTIYPNSNLGMLIVDKTVASRCMFTFINNQATRWSGVYIISSSGNTWTGWYEQYSSKNLTASKTSYDNNASDLSGTTVQSAIDECANKLTNKTEYIAAMAWTSAANLGDGTAISLTSYNQWGNIGVVNLLENAQYSTTYGKGIKVKHKGRVLVTAHMSGKSITGTARLRIMKNGTEVVRTRATVAQNSYTTLEISKFILEVNSGDVINMDSIGYVTGGENKELTYLTVELIS